MYEGLKEGEKAKETSSYAPVIDWGTLRILLSLSIQYNLHTTQVDFKNAFVQAPLERPMYMHLPPGLQEAPQYKGKILRLGWSLYGHRYVAKLFYELLCRILVEKLNFQVSPHDHCLFIWHDCLIVTWVDDTILITKTPGVADTIIKAIQSHNLDLDKQNDGGLAEYLGININRLPDGSVEMTQMGLTKQIIESLGLAGANGKFTPVTETLA